MDIGKDWKEELLSYRASKAPNQKMAGSSLEWLGVKVPKLKEIAASLAKDKDFDISSIDPSEYVETNMIYFMVGLSKAKNLEEQISFLNANSDKAMSWMSTDAISQYLHKPTMKELKPLFLSLIRKEDVFSRRIAYVIGLSLYKDPDIVFFFSHMKKDKRYYVYMAEAWLLQNMALTHFNEVLAFLESDKALVELKRKAISKIRDSYRFSEKQKEEVAKIRDRLPFVTV